MDHEVFEKEMFDGVNRHAEENSKCSKSTVTMKPRLFTKKDAANLTKGLRCMVFAIFTAGMFAVSVLGFIKVTSVTGYLAVGLFVASVLSMVTAIIFLYALGIIVKAPAESQGDGK